jgi:hypothetical protein
LPLTIDDKADNMDRKQPENLEMILKGNEVQ